MPTNFLHARFECPSCARCAEGVWEFERGALAGEDYLLGDRLRYDEAFSFFARTVGAPGGGDGVEVWGGCPVCGVTLEATVRLDGDTLAALEAVRVVG